MHTAGRLLTILTVILLGSTTIPPSPSKAEHHPDPVRRLRLWRLGTLRRRAGARHAHAQLDAWQTRA